MHRGGAEDPTRIELGLHELPGLHEAQYHERVAWTDTGLPPPADTSRYGPMQQALGKLVGRIYRRVLPRRATAKLAQLGAAFRERGGGFGGRSSLSHLQDRRGTQIFNLGTKELCPKAKDLPAAAPDGAFEAVSDVATTLVGDAGLPHSVIRLQVSNATQGGVLSHGPHADGVVVHKPMVFEAKTHEQLRWIWMSAIVVVGFVVGFTSPNDGLPRDGPFSGIFAFFSIELPAGAIYALTALLAGQEAFGFVRIGGKIYKLRIYHFVFGIKNQRALTVASVLVPRGGAATAIAAADRRLGTLALRYTDVVRALVAVGSPERFAPAFGAGGGLILDLGSRGVLCFGGGVSDFGGVPAVDADALAASVVSLPEARVLRREAQREARAVRDVMTLALGRLERRLETPAQREARRELRRARDALRRASDEGQVRAAMASALGRLFCRCKNSKCLKRYCVCFERGELCGDSCTCENCENVAGSAALREARAAIAEQPPSRGGCTCKKSRCLKRYCDCFRDGVKCVAACKCVDCQNGRPADAPAVEADAIAARPPKRIKASARATSCRPRAATREILIKWKLSGSMVAVTPVMVPKKRPASMKACPACSMKAPNACISCPGCGATFPKKARPSSD